MDEIKTADYPENSSNNEEKYIYGRAVKGVNILFLTYIFILLGLIIEGRPESKVFLALIIFTLIIALLPSFLLLLRKNGFKFAYHILLVYSVILFFFPLTAGIWLLSALGPGNNSEGGLAIIFILPAIFCAPIGFLSLILLNFLKRKEIEITDPPQRQFDVTKVFLSISVITFLLIIFLFILVQFTPLGNLL